MELLADLGVLYIQEVEPFAQIESLKLVPLSVAQRRSEIKYRDEAFEAEEKRKEKLRRAGAVYRRETELARLESPSFSSFE